MRRAGAGLRAMAGVCSGMNEKIGGFRQNTSFQGRSYELIGQRALRSQCAPEAIVDDNPSSRFSGDDDAPIFLPKLAVGELNARVYLL